ncbi:hypothetical protein FBU59_000232 [Linderina macrospora]|uniref:Uncharacterized protein n=1 Tax=Linderina macrospora TaxID=4868 RepID=A0ACC1JHQ2_9FUNG|nr:hypothetical protein FBU59_000232 [Linderina macrospora]
MPSIRVAAASFNTFAATSNTETILAAKGDAATASSAAAIAIPGSAKGKSPAMARRVSFNLNNTSVLQLPSNTAISKIAAARNRRSSMENMSTMEMRQAQALLPHGASPDLLDPGFTMTSLYVKRGHIHALEHLSLSDDEEGSERLPVRGVLKPFQPSPVDTKLLMTGLPSLVPDDETDYDSRSSSDDNGGQIESPVSAAPAVAERRLKNNKNLRRRLEQ